MSQVYGQRRGGEERRRKQPRIFQSHLDGRYNDRKGGLAVYKQRGRLKI